MKNKLQLFSALLFLLFSCNHSGRPLSKPIVESNHEVHDPVKNQISLQYKSCLPEDWEIWEEYNDERKIHLNHIGKGLFDLHFRAHYQMMDTTFLIYTHGKFENKYYPEFVIAFFENKESTKEAVRFTRENWKMISDTHPMYDIAETKHFLIYGGYNEDQRFQPMDPKLKELKECVMKKKLIEN